MSHCKPIRILLVEDNKINMLGLRLRLQKLDNYEIAGEATDGIQAVAKAIELRPDVVLMDVGLPHLNGIEACRLIKIEHPEACVIMLTLNEEGKTQLDCKAAGADSYCSKDIDTESLLLTIERGMAAKAQK